MKIVLLESLGIPETLLQSYASKLEEAGHEFKAYARDMDPQVQIQRVQDADVIMIANMPLKGEVIRACKNLKFINIAFTGVDHVDLDAAREMGVKVSNASGYSTQSVAELALGMMLSLLRNVPQVDARCRAGKTKDGLVGTELKGKTVGIVGAGAIGQNTARLCKAFGCRVIAYNHRPLSILVIWHLCIQNSERRADGVCGSGYADAAVRHHFPQLPAQRRHAWYVQCRAHCHDEKECHSD